MIEQSWFAHFGVLALLAVVPFLVIACTSFAKVAIVLGITRNAIGGQGVIPVTVVTALAMVITLFIMGPVVERMLNIPLPALQGGAGGDAADVSDATIFADAKAIYEAMSPPLIQFLQQNTPEDELAFFLKIDNRETADAAPLRVLLMAFASNELIESFVLGILILVPFLVVDIIVANTLTALGLTTLPAMAVALPLKLLLFIASDGWHVLVNALILSYNTA